MSMFTAHARREMKRLRAEEGLSSSEARKQVLSSAPDYEWRMLNFGTYTPTDKTIAALRSSVPPASRGLSAVVGRWGGGLPAKLTLGGTGPQHLLVDGAPGMGKSVLLASLAESVAARYSADEVLIFWGSALPFNPPISGVADIVNWDVSAVEDALDEGRRVLLVLDEPLHMATEYPQRVERLTRLLKVSGGRLHLVLGSQSIRGGSYPYVVGALLDQVSRSGGFLTFIGRGTAVQHDGTARLEGVRVDHPDPPVVADPSGERLFRVLRVAGRLRGDDLPAPAPTAEMYGR